MNIPYLDLGILNAQWQQEMEQAALRVVRSGRYLHDQEIADFEALWATANAARHCVSTANGLDALTAALCGLKHLNDWPDGSEVIVSGFTFIASFEAVTRAGLCPVPCDVSSDDYTIDPTLISGLITERTVAIMPVHIYGRESNMAAIREIADRHNLKIVTDSCQRHSTDSSLLSASSSLSDAVAFSFYPGKNLGALGDAGCLVTNDPKLADYARAYCNYGAHVKYRHDIKGVNSRMDSLQAAILKVKARYLNQQNSLRQEQAAIYNQRIGNPLISLPYGGKDVQQSVWHIYPVFCRQRDQLQQWLASNGIGTIVHYPTPPHKQLSYSELNHISLPVTEQLCATQLSLPLNPTLTPQEQDYIIRTLNDFCI